MIHQIRTRDNGYQRVITAVGLLNYLNRAQFLVNVAYVRGCALAADSVSNQIAYPGPYPYRRFDRQHLTFGSRGRSSTCRDAGLVNMRF
jgi:hypothetical protein